jgi:hypothetical protein
LVYFFFLFQRFKGTLYRLVKLQDFTDSAMRLQAFLWLFLSSLACPFDLALALVPLLQYPQPWQLTYR